MLGGAGTKLGGQRSGEFHKARLPLGQRINQICHQLNLRFNTKSQAELLKVYNARLPPQYTPRTL
jgi:hypothetical protein